MKKASTGSASQAISRPWPASAPRSIAPRSRYSTEAVRRAAGEAEGGIEAGRAVRVVDLDEIGRAAVAAARVKRRVRNERGLDLRLVVAGEEAAAAGRRADAGAGRNASRRKRAPPSVDRRRHRARRARRRRKRVGVDAERAGFGRARRGRGRPSGGRRRRPRRDRRRPSRQIGEGHGPDRSGDSGRLTDPASRGRLSLRLRSRPASSSDRASGCRGRRSRRR